MPRAHSFYFIWNIEIIDILWKHSISIATYLFNNSKFYYYKASSRRQQSQLWKRTAKNYTNNQGNVGAISRRKVFLFPKDSTSHQSRCSEIVIAKAIPVVEPATLVPKSASCASRVTSQKCNMRELGKCAGATCIRPGAKRIFVPESRKKKGGNISVSARRPLRQREQEV